MQINLKLMGILKDKVPASGKIELPEGATIDDALGALEITTETVQVITINGSIERNRQRQLMEGDELSVIPPVGGG